MSWSDYYQAVASLPAHYQVGASLKLLNQADQLLNQTDTMTLAITLNSQSARYLLGGLSDSTTQKTHAFDTRLLGDMSGHASFKKLLGKSQHGLDQLFRIIPANGPVDGWHYLQFIDVYQQLFAGHGFKQAPLYPATRLLAMKRPDQFLALNEITLPLVCQALTIKPIKKQEFQRYWDQVILTIQKTAWFKTFPPLNPEQIPVHRARVALLERFVSTELETASRFEPAGQTPASMSDEKQDEQAGISTRPSADLIPPERKPKTRAEAKTPKKLTIKVGQSSKRNQAAAIQLMSQYYFANKARYAQLNMANYRESIISELEKGRSVEQVFEEILQHHV